jgi:tetratricopeptide (TPR) repeat protein
MKLLFLFFILLFSFYYYSSIAQDSYLKSVEFTYKKGHFDSSIILLKEYLKDSTKEKSIKELARVYNIIGNILEDKGNFAEALRNYYKAKRYYYIVGDYKGTANAISNIANMYYRKGIYEKSLHFQILHKNTGKKTWTRLE